MAATVKELREWLETLSDDAEVGIDEGGLALVAVGRNEGAYLEVGGAPEDPNQ